VTTYSDVMAFLTNLGLGDGLDSFPDRIRIQKVVYLLKQFGADLNFGYTWYIRGPYSPSLTRTLFNPTEGDISTERELSSEELKIVNEVRNFLGGDFYSFEGMELIASLVYLIKHGPSKGLSSRAKISRFLNEQKPQYSSIQIDQAWDKIAKSKKWNAFLARLE